MTVVTQRLIIALRASLRATGNEVARIADPTTDDNTFSTPLRRATDNSAAPAVVGYWTSWGMDDAQRQRLIDEFGKRFAKTLTPIRRGGAVDTKADFWLFEAADGQWTGDEVLTAIGWARMPDVS